MADITSRISMPYSTVHFFAIKFKHVLKANAERHAAEVSARVPTSTWINRVSTLLRGGREDHFDIADASQNGSGTTKEQKKGFIQKLRPDMIRRVDDEPKRINPSGHAVPLKKIPTVHTATGHLSFAPSPLSHDHTKSISRPNAAAFEKEKNLFVFFE
ncbi:hypothetical protein C0991_011304 [Blastosporella zonata]|nr:hypothetical protein C0991_011304 [Blastosporella zonata]